MTTIDGSSIKKLIVACDAGMGSSVMLAGQLKKQLKKTRRHGRALARRAHPGGRRRRRHPGRARGPARGVVPDVPVVPFQLFLGDPNVAKIVKAIQDGTSVEV